MLVEFVEEGAGLRCGTVLENTLKDTTSVRVRSQRVHFSNAGISDEGELGTGNSFKRALEIGLDESATTSEAEGDFTTNSPG